MRANARATRLLKRLAPGWLCLSLAGCVPWTVVPIDGEPATDAASDPKAYVDSIWDTKLIPAARENAVPVADARAAAATGAALLVKGEGRVLKVEPAAPGRRLLVAVASSGEVTEVGLLVGPVIFGTAVRDAAGFIEFGHFTNQLGYADAAIELNRRVVEEVVAGIDMERIVGRTVAFLGAWDASADGPPQIVPLVLEVR